MMIIGIQSALKSELKFILNNIKISKIERVGNKKFYCGDFMSAKIIAVAGGIGEENSKFTTDKLISNFKISKLIFVGIGGAINPQIKIGMVVVSNNLVLRKTIHSSKLDEDRPIRTDAKMTEIAYSLGRKHMEETMVKMGCILTSHKAVTSKWTRNRLWNLYKADCAEMEGFFVGKVCSEHKIPFTIIRVISDSSGILAPIEAWLRIGTVGEIPQRIALDMIMEV